MSEDRARRLQRAVELGQCDPEAADQEIRLMAMAAVPGEVRGCATCGEDLEAGPCPTECRGPTWKHWVRKEAERPVTAVTDVGGV